MKFNCTIDNITIKQLAVISVIDSIFSSQSHEAVIESMNKDEIVFAMKANLSSIQQQRLFVDKVSVCLPGYSGSTKKKGNQNYMVVSKNGNK